MLAAALSGAGFRVAIHANGAIAQAERLAASLPGARAFQADLSNTGATEALIARVTVALGAPDLLINNAATFRYDTAGTFTAADAAYHLHPNLIAPITLVRDFAHARGTQPGAVINILDHKVTALNPDFFTYTLAKSAMAAATQTMAASFGGRIRVNGIAPGITLISGKQSAASFARAWEAPPLGRSSTPEEIAAACLFILRTPSLNGQILVLDGGESLLHRARDVAFDPALAPDA